MIDLLMPMKMHFGSVLVVLEEEGVEGMDVAPMVAEVEDEDQRT
jgi:hypothetical protein